MQTRRSIVNIMKKILAFCIILAVLVPAAVSASTADYSTIAYKELARHPDAHTGDQVTFNGEVNPGDW